MITDFSSEIMETRKKLEQHFSFKSWKKRIVIQWILQHPVKILFTNKDEMKPFSEKEKLRENLLPADLLYKKW